jgi:hypothetical protein
VAVSNTIFIPAATVSKELGCKVVDPVGNRRPRQSRLNTNIGDTRGKIAILLEARRRFDVNCLLPQCFRSLEEKALL